MKSKYATLVKPQNASNSKSVLRLCPVDTTLFEYRKMYKKKSGCKLIWLELRFKGRSISRYEAVYELWLAHCFSSIFHKTISYFILLYSIHTGKMINTFSNILMWVGGKGNGNKCFWHFLFRFWETMRIIIGIIFFYDLLKRIWILY